MNSTPTAGRQDWRIRLGDWVEAPRQQAFVTAIIIINALALGLNTVPATQQRFGHALELVDHVILYVFVVEIAAKLLRHGWRFFVSGWNIFDFLIVGFSLVATSGVFSVFRTLRILRTLRLLTKLEQLRRIVETMMRSLPGIAWVCVLLLILFYVFAIIGTTLFGRDHPELFGSLSISMYSLFELMTLEGWTTTARDVMKTHPLAYLYFIPFLLVASYILLNLVLGVIVSNTGEEKPAAGAAPAPATADTAVLLAEIRALHDRLERMEQRLGGAYARELAGRE